jgi:hypothetical protein
VFDCTGDETAMTSARFLFVLGPETRSAKERDEKCVEGSFAFHSIPSIQQVKNRFATQGLERHETLPFQILERAVTARASLWVLEILSALFIRPLTFVSLLGEKNL